MTADGAPAATAPGPAGAASAPTSATGLHGAADWYELFFDLVFVVVVAISAHMVEVDPSAGTVLVFALLLFPLWWAWVNLMVTNNLYGARFRALGGLVVASMPGPAVMAIAIAGGIEHYGWLYAAGAAWIRLVLLAMWLIPYRKRVIQVPLWRVLSYNLTTAAIWLVSIAVPTPYQYVLWAVAVAAEVVLLAARGGFAYQVYERASIAHGLERVGLFVVIVVGEAVYLSITALAEHPTLAGGAAGLFGFIVCALLARAFFRWGAPTAEAGLIVAQRAQSFGAIRDVIMYLPFFLVTALTLIAASIGIAVADANEPLPLSVRVLLACGIVGFYLVNALVGLRLRRPAGGIAMLLLPAIVLPAAACMFSGNLPAWATLGCAAIALALLEVVSRMLGAHAQRHVAHELTYE